MLSMISSGNSECKNRYGDEWSALLGTVLVRYDIRCSIVKDGVRRRVDIAVDREYKDIWVVVNGRYVSYTE